MTETELHEGIVVWPRSTPAREFLEQTAREMAWLYNNYTPDNTDEALRLKDGLNNLAALLADKTCPSPSKYFFLEGLGHFKECFTLSPHFVIKFCATRNATEDEENLYCAAVNEGFEHVFVPTVYVPLPKLIPSSELEKDDDEWEVYNEDEGSWEMNPDWVDDSDFNYICIQLRVTPLCDNDDPDNDTVFSAAPNESLAWGRTKEYLSLDDSLRAPLAGLKGTALPWVKAYLTHYGTPALQQLAQFFADHDVWDLHSENVGFISGTIPTPVILDWMSR